MMRISRTYFFCLRFNHFSCANSVLAAHVSLLRMRFWMMVFPLAPAARICLMSSGFNRCAVLEST